MSSRYDRADPSLSADYCEGLQPEPRIEVCDHCHGTGEIRTDADGPQDCPMCDSRGYLEVGA